MAYVRKVLNALGAVAVQVVRKNPDQRIVLAHVGSSHTDAQLGIILESARRFVVEDQGVLYFELAARTQRAESIANAADLLEKFARTKGPG